MPNPFESPDERYLALVNSAGQWSLWPARIPVPNGWSTAFGPAERTSCLDRIESSWTDPRPVPADTATGTR
jgi:MbtH protein